MLSEDDVESNLSKPLHAHTNTTFGHIVYLILDHYIKHATTKGALFDMLFCY